jgi:hypothetical protein
LGKLWPKHQSLIFEPVGTAQTLVCGKQQVIITNRHHEHKTELGCVQSWQQIFKRNILF